MYLFGSFKLTLILVTSPLVFVQDWRVEQARAKYRAAVSQDPLASLAREFERMMHFHGDIPPESALEAGRTLGRKRLLHAQRQHTPLPLWHDPTIDSFLLDPHGSNDRPVRYLGVDGQFIQPGAPFQNGLVLAFSRSYVWFEDLTGVIRIIPTGLPAQKIVSNAYLSTRAILESAFKARLASLLGIDFVYLGDPQPLTMEHGAESLQRLFEDLIADHYHIYRNEDRIRVVDSAKAQQMLKRIMPQVSPENLGAADVILALNQETKTDDGDTSLVGIYRQGLAWAARRMSKQPKEAYAFADRLITLSFNHYPTEKVTDDELTDLLKQSLGFDQGHAYPDMWRNVLVGFQQKSQGAGRFSERARRFARVLEAR